MLFLFGGLLHLSNTASLSNLARVFVDCRRVGVRFLHLSFQVFLFRLLFPVHLLHLLVIGSLEIIHVHFVGRLVNLALLYLFLLLLLFLGKLLLSLALELLKLLVALVKSLLVSFVGKEWRLLPLRCYLRALLVYFRLESRLWLRSSHSLP